MGTVRNVHTYNTYVVNIFLHVVLEIPQDQILHTYEYVHKRIHDTYVEIRLPDSSVISPQDHLLHTIRIRTHKRMHSTYVRT